MNITQIDDIIIEVRNYNTKANLSVVFEGLVDILGTKLIKKASHIFEPIGETIIGIISASHLTIHTYPEHDYLYINLNTCQPVKLDSIQNYLEIALMTSNIKIHHRTMDL